MIPELLFVALEFYREPRRFDHLRHPAAPLPAGVTGLLAAPANCLSDENIATTAQALNTSEEDCRAAVPFFVKQVLLEAGGDFYRTLGLERGADAGQIKEHYFYLMRLFHPDRGAGESGWDDLYAPRINEAYNTLRNPARREAYDAHLDEHEPDADADFVADSPMSAPPRPTVDTHRPLSGPVPGVLRRPWFYAVLVIALVGVLVLLLGGNDTPRLAVSHKPLDKPAEPARPYQSIGEMPSDNSERVEMAEREHPVEAPATSVGRARPDDSDHNDQHIEELIQARVARATRAVLGSSPPPTRTQARPDTPARDRPAPKPKAVAPTASQQAQVAAPVSTRLDQQPRAQLETRGVTQVQPEPDKGITLRELDQLLQDFADHYTVGDARAFSRLFTADADTTDARGRINIEQLYREFFIANVVRSFRFGQASWDVGGGELRRGSVPVRIVTEPHSGGKESAVDVTIQFQVQRTPEGAVQIARMSY